jgi:hypothetical protein
VRAAPADVDPAAMFTLLSYAGAAVIAALLLVRLARSYRSLKSIELLALGWFAAASLITFAGVIGPNDLLVGIAGLSMIGLGLFIGLDVRGIANGLSSRQVGFGGPLSPRWSPAYWRFSGFFVAMTGGVMTLAFQSAF